MGSTRRESFMAGKGAHQSFLARTSFAFKLPEKSSSSVETQTDSEPLKQLVDTEMQTERNEMVAAKTQTESPEAVDSTCQTAKTKTAEESMQTETKAVLESSVQASIPVAEQLTAGCQTSDLQTTNFESSEDFSEATSEEQASKLGDAAARARPNQLLSMSGVGEMGGHLGGA